MTLKARKNIIASSLGNYFGVGFNTPEQQLDFDLGLDEPFFSDLAKERMELGNAFEDAMLDYWENRLDIVIHTRNTGVEELLDNKLRVKVDGITTYQGKKTLVEAKYSLSSAGSFVNNRGYMLQCMAGMMAHDCEQALLLGLYQGEPHLIVIPFEQEVADDITEMTMIVWGILNGELEREHFPEHIVDKYSGNVIVEDEAVDFDENDGTIAKEYLRINSEIRELNKQKNELRDYMKSKYPYTKYEADDFKVTVTDRSRKGSIDMDKLKTDYPDIDLEAYRKPASKYKVVDIRAKKKK